MGDSLSALAGESMRDFNDLEWGCGMKVTFVVINIILLAITCVALGLPVYIMGYENNPYTFYFHNDENWHWVPPQETKVITFVFAIYCTVFDVPLTAFRIIQTAFNCCKCRDCLTIPYGLTHLITPIMYAAVAIICTVNKWGYDYWSKDLSSKHGKCYPYYICAALGTQVVLRIFLIWRMQSQQHGLHTADETQPLKENKHDVEQPAAPPEMDPPLSRPDRQKGGCCK